MSKSMSKTKNNNWDLAIADAERKIEEAKTKIRALKKSVATFQKLRDCGEPFSLQDRGQNEANV